METTTLADVQGALGEVATRREAKAAVRRAAKIVGVNRGQPLDLRELIRVCSALAAEGGSIQQLAEEIAGDALRV
jgi:indole-3-glycerol phosphate synthase